MLLQNPYTYGSMRVSEFPRTRGLKYPGEAAILNLARLGFNSQARLGFKEGRRQIDPSQVPVHVPCREFPWDDMLRECHSSKKTRCPALGD